MAGRVIGTHAPVVPHHGPSPLRRRYTLHLPFLPLDSIPHLVVLLTGLAYGLGCHSHSHNTFATSAVFYSVFTQSIIISPSTPAKFKDRNMSGTLAPGHLSYLLTITNRLFLFRDRSAPAHVLQDIIVVHTAVLEHFGTQAVRERRVACP